VLCGKYARFQTTIRFTPAELSIRYAFFVNPATGALVIDSGAVSSHYRIAQATGIERFGDTVCVFPGLMESILDR
jgi:hypothetical protein